MLVFLRVFDRAPLRFGARVALSELAFGAAVSVGGAGSVAVGAWLLVERGAPASRVAERSAVLFLFTLAINVITLVLAGFALFVGILPGPRNPLLSIVPAAVGLAAFASSSRSRRCPARSPPSSRRTELRTLALETARSIRDTERMLLSPSWGLLGAVGYLWFDIGVLIACFAALGHTPPLAVVVLAYQIGYLSNLIPVPGGIGALDGRLRRLVRALRPSAARRRPPRADRLSRDRALDPGAVGNAGVRAAAPHPQPAVGATRGSTAELSLTRALRAIRIRRMTTPMRPSRPRLVRDGEASPVELVNEAISPRPKTQPAAERDHPPAVSTEAREAAAGELPDGPFRGVPLLVKDLSCYMKGVPVNEGMRVLKEAGYRSDHDMEITARFRRAGFVILGRTNTPELGILPTTEPVAFGATHNPWDLDRSPGAERRLGGRRRGRDGRRRPCQRRRRLDPDPASHCGSSG